VQPMTIRYGAAALAALALGAAAAAQAQVAVPTVTVAMKEFTLTPSTTRLKAGRVTFVAVNRGKFPHALSIAGSGVKARTATVAPGKSARLTVTLKGGTYRLWCPVGTHASLGMELSLKVGGTVATGGAGGTVTTPATTTPDDGGYDPGYGY
jgi:uncharacterized cupredoxin-like copper-binding protein